MKKNILSISLLAVLVSFALIFAGCGKPVRVTGGGWIETCLEPDNCSMDRIMEYGEPEECEGEVGKVTFGFVGVCEENENCTSWRDPKYVGSGQLEWNDHVNDVKFHGVADGVEECGYHRLFGQEWGWIEGEYTPHPKNLGDGGWFKLCVYDTGEVGPDKGDWIRIELTGGVYDGYQAEGVLGGGNIVAHEMDGDGA
jgi:hypothetical protein